MRPRVPLPLRRQRLELPDGDFVDLDWCSPPAGGSDSPIVVLLHGLQGSAQSPYIRGMTRALMRRGMRAVVMHFRGCSGEPNRLPRGYHSGDTADLAHLVEQLRAREPRAPLAAIGYSLGGNVLLKWLGETGPDNPLSAAAAVGPPFELGPSADQIGRGCWGVYERHLLRSLLQSVGRKSRRRAAGAHGNLSLAAIRTIRQFDDRLTAPLHGFASAEDYYQRCSCRPFLAHIAVPTLVVHARNDPFIPPAVIPQEVELSPAVHLELSDDGGHIGFVSGRWPWAAEYWLESRVPVFLEPRVNVGCSPRL
jgi:uncharacterized protein